MAPDPSKWCASHSSIESALPPRHFVKLMNEVFYYIGAQAPNIAQTELLPFVHRQCDSSESVRYVENIFSFERPGIGFTIVYAVVEAVVFFALVWFLEVCK